MKCVITERQYADLMMALEHRLRPDENADETAYYPVVSLYYDNAERDCFWERYHGNPSRRKIRVRLYGTSDGRQPPTCFLEVKHKDCGRGVKRRVKLPLEAALQAASGATIAQHCTPAEQRVLQEVRHLVETRHLQPCCVIRYDRHAYADRDPTSDLRVTFDTRLRYRMDPLDIVPDDQRFSQWILPENYAVLEVKGTGAVPFWFSQLLGQLGCVFRGHSKYSCALESGDPVIHRMAGGRIKPHGVIASHTSSPASPASPIALGSPLPALPIFFNA